MVDRHQTPPPERPGRTQVSQREPEVHPFVGSDQHDLPGDPPASAPQAYDRAGLLNDPPPADRIGAPVSPHAQRNPKDRVPRHGPALILEDRVRALCPDPEEAEARTVLAYATAIGMHYSGIPREELRDGLAAAKALLPACIRSGNRPPNSGPAISNQNCEGSPVARGAQRTSQ